MGRMVMAGVIPGQHFLFRISGHIGRYNHEQEHMGGMRKEGTHERGRYEMIDRRKGLEWMEDVGEMEVI
jgi:hypothetical protein